MTAAYCSPEQARMERLSRGTDIWSWGLSILEMFAGRLFWARGDLKTGQMAPQILEDYLEMGPDDESIPKMPDGIVDLLRQCFRQQPGDRPESMDEIVHSLKSVHREIIGSDYTRPEPQPVRLLADALNNRGVSMLDLARKDDAERFFQQALQSDPHHVEATLNLGLLQWRAGKITDASLRKQLLETRATHDHDWRPIYFIGLIYLECFDTESALFCLEKAAQLASQPDVQATLNHVRGLAKRSVGHVRTLPSESMVARAISADGCLGLSGSWGPGASAAIHLWDLQAGQRLRAFKGHRGWISSLCFSRDALWALSASTDNTLRLWETATGKCVRVFEGHTSAVSSVSLSSDGRQALSGSADGTLRLWDLAGGECLRVLKGRQDVVYSVALSPDGCRALSGGGDGTVRLWDLADGQWLRTFEEQAGPVCSVAFSPDGCWVLSGGDDYIIRFWEQATGRCLRTFRGTYGRCHFLKPERGRLLGLVG